jgi:hypothetical protein
LKSRGSLEIMSIFDKILIKFIIFLLTYTFRIN